MNNPNSYQDIKHDRYGDYSRSLGAAATQRSNEARPLSSSGDIRKGRKKGKNRDKDRANRRQQNSFEIQTPKILTKANKLEGNVISILNGNHTTEMQPSQDTDKDQKSILNATKVSPPVMIKANEKMKHDVNNKSKPGLANVVSGNEKVQTVSGNTRLLSHLKLKEQQRMTKCAKLVDRFNQWTNLTSEHFLDQSDYLVVGVIGLEGVGKSSIMSRLTNIGTLQKHKIPIFQQQNINNTENSLHQTEGIDLFITSDRMILLDTQPILSSSITNHIINNTRNYRLDDTPIDVYMEIQSLKQVSFLYSVCHVVIVVQDWFTDLSLLRFLLTAEMLTKPTSSEINAKEVSSLKEQSNQLPNIVFVYNRACEKDYHPDCLNSMLSVTEELFRHSRLRYRGSVSQFQFEVVNATGISKSLTDINIFLLPIYDCNEKESDKFDTASAENPNSSPTNLYIGHPNYDVLYQSLENQILAIPRDSFSNSLTERGWLNYAMQCWEQIERSSVMMDYKRLLLYS